MPLPEEHDRPLRPEGLGQPREADDIREEDRRVLPPGHPQVMVLARELGRDIGREVAREVLPGALRAHALEDELPRARHRERGDPRHEQRDQYLLHARDDLNEVRRLSPLEETIAS